MHLVGSDGISLVFGVVGYEFPDLVGVPYDSNWLIIAGRAEKDGIGWKFNHPCLLTNEVSSLADWLEARSQDPTKDSEISFIEPNLGFKWFGGALRVTLAVEFRPPWAPWDEVEGFYLQFSPTSEDLALAALSLRDDLRKFPIRPE